MKKQRVRVKPTGKQRRAAKAAEAIEQEELSRRGLLLKLRNYGLAAAVLGGGGYIAVAKVQDAMAEEDLSRIGDGIPTVVQIHDPQCSQCLALQREARAAMSEFGDGEIKYVVANIRQSSGRAFAAKHGVAHVTLMIFDGDGERKLTLRGQNSRARLSAIFRRHTLKAPTPTPKPAPVEAEPSIPATS
jgi:hypothetical protein